MSGCGGAPRPATEQAERPLPAAIIVDRIIEGEILGASLSKPWGIAVADDGHLYATDNGNNRLIVFDKNLNAVRDVGGFGSAEGFFNRPTFVTTDRNLNILVTDEGNRRLCRFNSQLLFVEAVAFYDEDDPLKFAFPSGIAVTAFGEMWAGDRENDRIAVFSNVGRFNRFIGDFGYSGGQVISPEAIRIAPSDRFLVCDAGNSRLALYDQYGNYERELIDDLLEYPIAATPDGNRWWVLDGATGRIVLITQKGEVLYDLTGQLMGTPRPLRRPSDIAVLPNDRLAIADTGNDRIVICKIIREQE
jgi:DNA-binding beta-propeller fold protein YncE